ncbi:HAD family hydrolase [Dysgonomonas sp. 25]|nr:HAD family hydrolase [Dysgonomonas sp. 25]
MKYKHIVFDIDGTMLDTEHVLLDVLQQVIFELQGRRVEQSELLFTSGIPGDVALRKLGFEDVAAVNDLWNERFKQHFHAVRLFDGIEAVLQKLQEASVTLGIITSKTHAEYEHDFLPFSLAKYFTTVICVSDVDHPKPSPDSMLKYMELTGANPREILYIGDTQYDMQCAKGAGADFALALWDAASRYEGADYYLSQPEEIVALLG